MKNNYPINGYPVEFKDDTNLLKEIKTDYKNKDSKKVIAPVVSGKKKRSIRPIVITSIVLLIILAIATFVGLEVYAKWRKSHEWQNPITINWVGLVKEIKPVNNVLGVETKVLTDMEIIEQYKLAPVLKSIYMLESTQGKNDACKDKGKVNGYGYRQNSSEWVCFDSFADVTKYVNGEIEDRLSKNGNNLIEAVCYYNTGKQYQSTCGDYSENFVSVITKYL